MDNLQGVDSSASSPPVHHPAADPDKLIVHYDDWERGDELPGRTLSYFKTGMLPDLLTSSGGEEARRAAVLAAILVPWEKGKASPGEVMSELEEAGLRDFLAEMAR